MSAGGDGHDGAEQPVRVVRAEGVAWMWLDRPAQRNAISMAMRQALIDAMAELGNDDDVRIVVLTGAGPAFCAGVDLKEQTDGAPHVEALRSRPVALPLYQFEKPLLAAINGAAVGGGLELALAADLRIASTTARFGLPEVKIGSLPGSGGTQQLVRAMSPALARQAIFTGELFDAQTALRGGLVSDVVEPERLIEEASRIAHQVAANSPLSLRAAKLALAATQSSGPGLALERALWGLLSVSADRAEGRSAFREHRAPRFTGQ
ncbi:MAG TPA: enoyl-CoA hydratase/isomerase family protein [Solirubrobacteraceae bacterium]|nr:enoyl-CoA hydratase/isomerase family protein [Solirubrobacteraceae bacterium]